MEAESGQTARAAEFVRATEKIVCMKKYALYLRITLKQTIYLRGKLVQNVIKNVIFTETEKFSKALQR